jgi:hypothetical protein
MTARVEQREFKTAEHLQRVLAFDLIVAWRVLACVKLGSAMPQLPGTVLNTPEDHDEAKHACKVQAAAPHSKTLRDRRRAFHLIPRPVHLSHRHSLNR